MRGKEYLFVLVAVLFCVCSCVEGITVRKEKHEVVGRHAAARDHPVWDIIHLSASHSKMEDTVADILAGMSPEQVQATEYFFHKHFSESPDYSYEAHLELLRKMPSELHPNNIKVGRNQMKRGAKPVAKYLSETIAQPFPYKDFDTWISPVDFLCQAFADDKGMKATASILFAAQVVELVAAAICKSMPQCLVIIPILIEIPLSPAVMIPCGVELVAKIVKEIPDAALYLLDYCVVYRPVKHIDEVGANVAPDNYKLMAQITKWRMESTLARNIRSPFMSKIYGGLLTEVSDLMAQTVSTFKARGLVSQDPGPLSQADSAYNEAKLMEEENFDKFKKMSFAYDNYSAAYRQLLQTAKSRWLTR